MIMAAITQIIARWQLAAGLAAALMLALTLSYCEGRKDGRAIEQARAAKLEQQRNAALASEEAALRKLAKDADNAINKSRVAHATVVERFIQRGGVQPCAVGNQPKDRSAGSGEAVREAPVLDGADELPVTVWADDVRICTDNTLIAEGLRSFVLGLEGE
jgi:hypothetical protein